MTAESPTTGEAARRGRPLLRIAYLAVLVLAGAVALARLALGALAFAATLSPELRARFRTAGAAITAAATREPAHQIVAELAFSLLALALGAAILLRRPRDRPMRLAGLAMLAVAGTGNLWLQATVAAVPRAAISDVLLQSITIAALTLALLAYPAAGDRRGGPGQGEFVLAAGGAAGLGLAAALVLPAVLSYVGLFAVALPATGVLLLRHRGRDDLAGDERTQVRLLYTVLVGAAAAAATLLLVTVLVWRTGWTGLTLADPVGQPPGPALLQQTALLFWFGRVLPVAIAVAALTAGRRERLYVTQRRFSLGLVVALVATLDGGLFVVVHTVLSGLADGRQLAAAVPAAAAAALLLYPTYVRVERWVDQLLYGRRPTPYSVLAGITSLSQATSADAPDLARVAEAVGRGLDARVCRLTVQRPDLPDRTYAWSDGPAADAGALLTVPIVHGDDRLGEITVDRATAAGLHVQRQRLVEDIADSLGAVLQARRLGIELERQLRAVRAHAADIAASRRRLVAEMDAERRRIERDLHDGAQHHLVSLRLSLGLVDHQLGTGQTERAAAALAQVSSRIEDAEAVLARTATGVSSPLLTQQGLVAALTAELAGGEPAVEVTTEHIDPGRRFPEAVETAVWYSCLEAVGNARKHAPGAHIRVTLRAGDVRLDFHVHDDGPGWDPSANGGSAGRGMRNVTARVAAAGGQLSIGAEPGAGTRIDGWVPLPPPPPGADSTLVATARDTLRQAHDRYADAAGADQINRLRTDLDEAVAAATRRDAIRAAWSALQELDALIRADPPPAGAADLIRELERIRFQAHDLAEVQAIDALRAGTYDLNPGEADAAARLLGEDGSDPRNRLGLAPNAAPPEVAAAAERAVQLWRTRASHPATAPGVRALATTVVQSCEQLLHAS